jgi:hypothetical protein
VAAAGLRRPQKAGIAVEDNHIDSCGINP